MSFTNIKKSILILRCVAYNLESTIELLYQNGVKIDRFKMLLDNENLNSYFPNINKYEKLVMMVVKGEDVLNKLTKIGILDNKYIYVPKTLEETKEQYNKIFNQKQKRI